MNTSKQIVAMILAALGATATHATDGPALCATPEQAAAVQALYAKDPVPPPFMAGPKLGVPEAVVLSALRASVAVGVSGSEFARIWASLQTWDTALTLVLKAGNVFEIHGKIPPGKPSEKSAYFNLENGAAPLGGHLRPDLVSAIYAVQIAGPEGLSRGLEFLDAKGENAFGVYISEGGTPPPELVAQFGKTWDLIAGLPRVCPGDK